MKLNLHGEIENGDNSITSLVDNINNVSDGETIELSLNSFGGDTMDGMLIGEALLKHTGHTKISIDGMCGSMGAFLLTYCDYSEATPGASFMFHKASCTADNPDAGALKIVSNINKNFRNRMVERGFDAELIKNVFDRNKEIYLSAFEAKQKGVITSVVKNERIDNNPYQRIVASIGDIFKSKKKLINNYKIKTMGKMNFVAIVDENTKSLLVAFQAPEGVIEKGTVLIPTGDQEIVAGTYTFEGNEIIVDADGVVTAIKEIEEPEDKPEAITAESIATIVAETIKNELKTHTEGIDAKIEAATKEGMTGIEAKLKTALKAVGSDYAVAASFDDKSVKKKTISSKVSANISEEKIKKQIKEKLKIK